MPERIQRRRTRGWRMPEGAVYVGRPSKWGNPLTMEAYRAVEADLCMPPEPDAEVRRELTQAFRSLVKYGPDSGHWSIDNCQQILGICAGLDAEPTSVANALRDELEAIDLNPWKARAQKAQHEARMARETIARVEAELDRLDGAEWSQGAVKRGAETAIKDIRAALNPPKPFEPPKFPGSRFTARGVDSGEEVTFRTYCGVINSTTIYVVEGHTDWWTAEGVMESWTDHRLIEAQP